VIEHPEDLSVAEMRHRDVLDAIALLVVQLTRLQDLVEKIALGMGIRSNG
jgi:hypothetical protein